MIFLSPMNTKPVHSKEEITPKSKTQVKDTDLKVCVSSHVTCRLVHTREFSTWTYTIENFQAPAPYKVCLLHSSNPQISLTQLLKPTFYILRIFLNSTSSRSVGSTEKARLPGNDL